MTEKLKRHYQALFRKFGDSSSSVQYFDRASHFKRFEILTEMIREKRFSIVDLGCGLGHLCEYLRQSGADAAYLGLVALLRWQLLVRLWRDLAEGL